MFSVSFFRGGKARRHVVGLMKNSHTSLILQTTFGEKRLLLINYARPAALLTLVDFRAKAGGNFFASSFMYILFFPMWFPGAAVDSSMPRVFFFVDPTTMSLNRR